MTVSDLLSKGPGPDAACRTAQPTMLHNLQSLRPDRLVAHGVRPEMDEAADASRATLPRSIFASLVNRTAAEPKPMPRAEPMAEPRTAGQPLVTLGFGPGMLLRLGQLGLHTTADLAHADAEQLRAELGTISRLVDVEAWIAQARQSLSRA